MTDKQTGGPAFPFPELDQSGALYQQHEGMTLRDYFAAKALDVAIHQVKDYYGADKNSVAIWCYDMADAMLKAREQ